MTLWLIAHYMNCTSYDHQLFEISSLKKKVPFLLKMDYRILLFLPSLFEMKLFTKKNAIKVLVLIKKGFVNFLTFTLEYSMISAVHGLFA